MWLRRQTFDERWTFSYVNYYEGPVSKPPGSYHEGQTSAFSIRWRRGFWQAILPLEAESFQSYRVVLLPDGWISFCEKA